MHRHLPEPSVFLQAIDAYLHIAYKGEVPSAVRMRVETLKAMPPKEFYDCAALERDNARHPHLLFLRLGNQTYPHMKLALIRKPCGQWAFCVEEHDQVGVPKPASRDYRFFQEMVCHNHELALKIEARWSQTGIPVVDRSEVSPMDGIAAVG